MQFYKLLSEDLRHHNFEYKEGLNIDTLGFNPVGQCQPGGLYYTSFEQIGQWYNDGWPLIADVTLPPGALVYPEPCGTKWKADRIVLSNIRHLKEFLAEQSEEQLITWLHQCQRFGRMLQHIGNQTPAICATAVQGNPQNLFFVYEQNPQLCKVAVQLDPQALWAVRQQTADLVALAVQFDWEAFRWVNAEYQTEELCLAAVAHSGLLLQYVQKQTPQICEVAVRRNGCAIQFVRLAVIPPGLLELAQKTACTECLMKILSQ